VKKLYEVLHLYFKHYLPAGKPFPEYYREVFYELFKIWKKGCLEELTKEPIVQETVLQLELYKELPKQQLTIDGMDVDRVKPKT